MWKIPFLYSCETVPAGKGSTAPENLHGLSSSSSIRPREYIARGKTRRGREKD